MAWWNWSKHSRPGVFYSNFLKATTGTFSSYPFRSLLQNKMHGRWSFSSLLFNTHLWKVYLRVLHSKSVFMHTYLFCLSSIRMHYCPQRNLIRRTQFRGCQFFIYFRSQEPNKTRRSYTLEIYTISSFLVQAYVKIESFPDIVRSPWISSHRIISIKDTVSWSFLLAEVMLLF